MKITLQKQIGYFWLVLAAVNLINSVYQIIRSFGTWGLNNASVFSRPYFEQIYPYLLFEPTVVTITEDCNAVRITQLSYLMVLNLISVLIPIILILNVKYSRTIAKIFLIIFISLNAFAIYVHMTILVPYTGDNPASKKYLLHCIYYYLTMSCIAILLLIGLFYCVEKVRKNAKAIE